MKYLRFLAAYSLIFFAFQNVLYAQWKPQSVTIPSANASSLGLYGEIPVSYFTGVPGVSVPIYELKGKNIGLKIELNYNTVGLRPEVHPGWVGNGWSLQAGGVITRKANALIDEYNKTDEGKIGYYWNYANLQNTNWSSSSTLSSAQAYPPVTPTGQTGNNVSNDVDSQPDEFIFNFLSYSGKFFLDQNGQWQVQCDKNLKVIFNSNDFVDPFIKTSPNVNTSEVTKTFGKFTLIDENGTQYIFGSTDANNSAIEFDDSMIPHAGLKGSSFTATSWYLSQIVSSDGSESINFSYERGPFTSQISYGYNKAASITGNACNVTFANQNGLTGNILSPVYLTKITMPSQDLELDFNKSESNELTYPLTSTILVNGVFTSNAYTNVYNDAGISFNSSGAPSDFPSFYLQDFTSSALIPYFGSNPAPAATGNGYCNRLIWLKLDGIIIKNSALGIVERGVNFSYNNNPSKRLQLNNLQLTDKSGAAIQVYSFNYNSTALPGYLTTITDHWGFNNNQTAAGNTPNFDQLRSPDATGVLTQAENLIGITYPTGGHTTYTYEPNSYSQVIYRNNGNTTTNESGIAGGLRIRQITSTDNNGGNITKSYFYVNGFTSNVNPTNLPSSGVLDSKPLYSFINSGVDNTGQSFQYQSVSSNSVLPLTISSTGTHIGYTNVIEQRSDGAYSVYNFTNHDNGYTDLNPVNSYNKSVLDYFQPTSLAYKRGKVIGKIDYNSNGKPVQEIAYNYSSNVTYYTTIIPELTAHAVVSSTIPICDYNNRGAVSRTAYLLNYEPFVPVAQTIKSYDLTGTNYVTKILNTQYDVYKNVIQQDVVNSDGQTVRQRYWYAYDFTSANVNNPYNAMVNLNIVSPVIERISTVLDPSNGVEYVTGGEIHTYLLYGPNKIYNDAVYNFESTVPVSFSQFGNASYKGVSSFSQLNMDNHFILRESLYYDDSGNISTVVDNSGKVKSYLWDYNKSKPVAVVKNGNNIYSGLAPANNVAISNTISTFIPGVLSSPVKDTITVTRTGPITLTFAYLNQSLSGNNSSNLNYQLTGNSQYQSGNLCASTPGGTSACGYASTVTINNVSPGTYVLYLTLNSMAGFQNYYGFNTTISYPTYQYYTANSKTEIAYTSFEYNTGAALSYGTGNWTGINISNIVSGAGALTGSNYYNLSGSSISSPALNAAQIYIVSYWSKSGQMTVSGTQTVTQGITLPSGWINFKHIVTNSSSVTVSGNGSIDELRLCPKGTEMTTYSYESLVGIKNVVSPKQQVTSYQYDNFQRLSQVLDQNGSVTSGYNYNYAGVSQPIINNIFVSGPQVITVNYTPITNCVSGIINYTDLSTGQTGSSAGGCSGSSSITVPNSGHTYSVTITCSTGNMSVTSAPLNITVQ